MPRTLVARVLSQQARNSFVPCPSDPDDPSSRSRGGVVRGAFAHRCPVLSCPVLMDDRWKDSMGGQADEHMSRLNWSPTAPVLSIVDELLVHCPGPPRAQT